MFDKPTRRGFTRPDRAVIILFVIIIETSGRGEHMSRTFSEAMSALRHERGLSQRKAAAELRISQALLSHYENGAREPGLDFVVRACDYYGVSADYLLGRTDKPGGGAQGERVRALAAELRALADKIEGIAEDDET